jgi:hypothetical protein
VEASLRDWRQHDDTEHAWAGAGLQDKGSTFGESAPADARPQHHDRRRAMSDQHSVSTIGHQLGQQPPMLVQDPLEPSAGIIVRQQAVRDPSMYHNCRLRIVQGQEVCRCAILPQALRKTNRMTDRDDMSTGSLSRNSPAIADNIGPGIGSPVAGAPSTGAPVAGRPTVGGPVVANPRSSGSIAGTPNAGAPVADRPSAGSPVASNPSTGIPNTGNPNTGTPGTSRPGNPGNDKGVGNAGENPNGGGGWGDGTKGCSDGDNGNGHNGGSKNGGGTGNGELQRRSRPEGQS